MTRPRESIVTNQPPDEVLHGASAGKAAARTPVRLRRQPSEPARLDTIHHTVNTLRWLPGVRVDEGRADGEEVAIQNHDAGITHSTGQHEPRCGLSGRLG